SGTAGRGTDMPDLTGKTVVVTGAARGQGAAEAVAAARAGARVIATDVLDDEGTELVAAFPDITYRHLDVSSPADWTALAESLEAVDGLVNNAGIPVRSRLHEVTVEDWDRAIAVNLTGAMLGIQTLLPLMQPGSSIVNVGSVAALTAHHTVA